jgi:hypothetical protein
MELFILVCWCIYTERNDLIFKAIQPSTLKCRTNVIKGFNSMLLHGVKRRIEPFLVSWIENSFS